MPASATGRLPTIQRQSLLENERLPRHRTKKHERYSPQSWGTIESIFWWPTSVQPNNMRPASSEQAQQQMRKLLGRKIPGRRAAKVKEHTKRALQIADILYRQFQVGPYQYRQKHLKWYLNTHIQALTPASQYRHWLTLKIILVALDKEKLWVAVLHGPWQCPLPINRSRQ